MEKDIKDLIFFKPYEFECKCGCGLNNINPYLAVKLDFARSYAGVPFVITSACRCEKHNKAVGGIKTSSHLKGLAVDIKVKSDKDRYLIMYGLLRSGFKRILIYKDFIHTDMDESKINPIIKLM